MPRPPPQNKQSLSLPKSAPQFELTPFAGRPSDQLELVEGADREWAVRDKDPKRTPPPKPRGPVATGSASSSARSSGGFGGGGSVGGGGRGGRSSSIFAGGGKGGGEFAAVSGRSRLEEALPWDLSGEDGGEEEDYGEYRDDEVTSCEI